MSSLPPGPPSGRLAQAVRFQRDPLGFLRQAQAAYGDAFTIHLAVAGHMVVFASAEAVEQLLLSDPGRAHTGEARRRIVGIISPRSVLGADGEHHHRTRGRLAPAFAPDRLAAQREAMARIADAHVATWPRLRPFRVLPRVRAIADELFVRLVLGVDDDARARALAAAIRRMLWTPGNPPLPLPDEHRGLAGRLGKAFFERRSAPVARLLASEIEAHRSQSGGDGLIAMVARAEPAMRTEDAVDELIPVLMAAQEPMAAALTWLLDRLGREQRQARHFVRAPAGDPYRDAFVRETLRIRPAVHSVARRLTEPARIAGHDLPAGAVAMVPIVLVHRDAAAFPYPDDFRPERFLRSSDPAPLEIPFGGGARRCLGEPLAHAQIGSVLPAILRRVRLRPLSRRPERMVVRGTVAVPQRSGLMVAWSA